MLIYLLTFGWEDFLKKMKKTKKLSIRTDSVEDYFLFKNLMRYIAEGKQCPSKYFIEFLNTNLDFLIKLKEPGLSLAGVEKIKKEIKEKSI